MALDLDRLIAKTAPKKQAPRARAALDLDALIAATVPAPQARRQPRVQAPRVQAKTQAAGPVRRKPNLIFLPLSEAMAAHMLPAGAYTEMPGSGAQPYTITHHADDTWSCSCPAWRFQSGGTVRTCKHLMRLLGSGPASARQAPTKVVPAAKAQARGRASARFLLAEKWKKTHDPTGWLMSEKLDGVRAHWNGHDFTSRLGNVFHAPDWFKAHFPPTPLDGELFLGRGRLNETTSIVRSHGKDERWREIRFMVIDVPEDPRKVEARLVEVGRIVERACKKAADCPLRAIEHVKCTGRAHLEKALAKVQKQGGEGLMLRKPESLYEPYRSWTLLKVVTKHREEAEVTGYEKGTGKHAGRLGAYRARLLSNGADFKVGTGITDAERSKPVPVGTIITVEFKTLTPAGVPREPSYIGARTYE